MSADDTGRPTRLLHSEILERLAELDSKLLALEAEPENPRVTKEFVDYGLKWSDDLRARSGAEDRDRGNQEEHEVNEPQGTQAPQPPPQEVMDKADGVRVTSNEVRPAATTLVGSIPPDCLNLFLIECQEHLNTIELNALALANEHPSRENLDALFRAVHTIKGNAGLLMGHVPPESLSKEHPLPVLARIAHAIESVLDHHRQEADCIVARETIELVLKARDVMHTLLEVVSGDRDHFIFPAKLLERLASHDQTVPSSQPDTVFLSAAVQCLEVLDNCVGVLESGQTSGSVLKTYERVLGTLLRAAVHQKIDGLNEPITAQLRILKAARQSGAAVSDGDRNELRSAVAAVRARVHDIRTREDGSAAEKPSTPQALSHSKLEATAPSTTVRIDQAKLDRLMRIVGELLVAKGRFPTLVERLSGGEDRGVVTNALRDTGTHISHVAEELQASVLAIRMLPVKTVFQRFPRVVHDVAQSLGKQVQLAVDGETIELDKGILEQIGDPLVHLVRNAVDHGLEPAEERVRTGKAATGRVTLRASNEAGKVLIEVEDDGRGLDCQSLKQKAIEKGLITPEAALAMAPADVCRLVFMPGLSTAEKITDLSGRGVGMDVVWNNIRSLQGTVDIRSSPGKGTVFSIKLPTSLIISKGILLKAGGEEYILPLSSIRDMVKIPASAIHGCGNLRYAQVRGQVYPVFWLAELLGLPLEPVDELSMAIMESGKGPYALVADRFVNEVEVLVKPLTGALGGCRQFHGSAIMGDGRVVLVLDPGEYHPCVRPETARVMAG